MWFEFVHLIDWIIEYRFNKKSSKRILNYVRLRYRVGLFCPTREIFIHTETSLLPMKGCLCSPLIAIEQWWFFFQRATRTITRNIRLYWSSLRTSDSHSCCRVLLMYQWSCHYLFLRLWSVAPGIRTPNLSNARRTL